MYKFDSKRRDYDGAGIKAYWETPWMDFGRNDAVKTLKLKYAFGSGRGAKLVLDVFSEKVHRRKVVDMPEADGNIRIPLKISGRRLKLRLANYSGELGVSGQAGHMPEILPVWFELKGGITLDIDFNTD